MKSDAGGTQASVQINGTDAVIFKAGQSIPKSGVLTEATTVAWDISTLGQVVSLATTGIKTIGAPSNVVQNAMYMLILDTGGHTPLWNTVFKWVAGEAPSGLADATYIFTFVGGAGGIMIATGPGFKTGAT